MREETVIIYPITNAVLTQLNDQQGHQRQMKHIHKCISYKTDLKPVG